MNHIEVMKQALDALEGIHPGNMGPTAEEAWNKAIAALRQVIEGFEQMQPVAWDVYERRIYGLEEQHRVLWVEHYRLPDGTTPDLDWLIEEAKKGGIDSESQTITVTALYTQEQILKAFWRASQLNK